ncbi:single-stranded DNA-binding protein [Candidatus Phytoplasma tritici]|uniref:single-stranded DNA-binding protein n=1 Tax=Candidatus Phytoplasma tritici TaxID=321961 RepID=UPI00040AE857|nr:single-stranded DNA-binding protein [Candidatus Phytoplasma tritici]
MLLAKKTNFITCTVFDKQADNLEKYISKGALIGVEGNIRVDNLEKVDGTTAWKFNFICNSVQFLESKKI